MNTFILLIILIILHFIYIVFTNIQFDKLEDEYFERMNDLFERNENITRELEHRDELYQEVLEENKNLTEKNEKLVQKVLKMEKEVQNEQ